MNKYNLLVLTALTSSFFTSCNLFDSEWNSSIREVWEDQLAETMECEKIGDDLSLISYQYLGRVQDEDVARNLYDEILSDKSELPAYRGSLDGFSMETWREIKNNPCDNINQIFFERYVDSLLETSPGIVELTWSYKRKVFKTKSLISNKTHRIEYDNVLSHLVIGSFSTEANRLIVPRKKTRTESHSEYELAYHYENSAEITINGNKVGAYIEYTVYGEYDSHHDKDIKKRTMNSWKSNYNGSNYNAIAAIKEINFSTGTYVSGCFEVSYVYGIAPTTYGMTSSYNYITHTYALNNAQHGATGHDFIYPHNLTANNSY